MDFDLIDVPIFESEDEIDDVEMPRLRKEKRFRERVNYFEEFDDSEFLTRFRLQKETCQNLLREIEPHITSATDRNEALSPTTKLLLTLRFYATGTMLLVVADFSGVSKSSACVAVKQVSEAIANLGNIYIQMPTTREDKERVQQAFYEIARFPCVVGAIDCTHIRIQSPGGDNAEIFRNRKGYFSWNVQAVCDAELRILNIVARWPGSTHDQHIFNNSAIKAKFDTGELGNSILLGDSGYANTNYLLTPLPEPHDAVENLYNESHIRSRNAVERMFGVWKRRFPILSLGMRVSLEKSQTIIVATAVLQNIAVNERNAMPADEFDLPLQNDIHENHVQNNHQRNNGQNARRIGIIRNHFAPLL